MHYDRAGCELLCDYYSKVGNINRGKSKKDMIQDENAGKIEIGKIAIWKSRRDPKKVWMENEEGEGGEFSVELLEKTLGEFFNKYF